MNVGIDIEEVKRFQSLIKNKRFLKRVFSVSEITYCQAKKNKSQHFAVRFAAKEAVWKALSEVFHTTGLKISHKDICVRNTPHGKPQIVLPKRLSRWVAKTSISLSHTRSHAIAIAVIKD